MSFFLVRVPVAASQYQVCLFFLYEHLFTRRVTECTKLFSETIRLLQLFVVTTLSKGEQPTAVSDPLE